MTPKGDSGLPTFSLEEGPIGDKSTQESPAGEVANQAFSWLALLTARATEWDSPSRSKLAWLGEGLGSISKRVYDKMMKWEFVDMAELRPRSMLNRRALESDTQHLIVFPGLEVSQPRKKPIRNIMVWCQCFARYTAAMSAKFPDCTPGFMSHMLTVLQAHAEVEEPYWLLYDEAYREKMASTGVRKWRGRDLSLYQEICGGQARKGVDGGVQGSRQPMKRPSNAGSVRHVCYGFNDGYCTFGKGCKFPHLCQVCHGNHPRSKCGSGPPLEKQPRRV